MEKALITGITGQDGSYLTELLLQPGYEIHGFVRRSSSLFRARIDHLLAEKNTNHLRLHYVEAVWLMLQNTKPDDFVVASGVSHSVREFVETAARYASIDLDWLGDGILEHRIDRRTGKIIVGIDPKSFRPAKEIALVGDPTKIISTLNWKPTVDFGSLVHLMMDTDAGLR